MVQTVSAPILSAIDGKPTTTSLDVARHFGKLHLHVMRGIRDLLADLPADHQSDFGLMTIEVEVGNGAKRPSPAYRLTRDGFTLLAMGFTGPKALAFELAYLDAFNRMEAQLTAPATPPSIQNKRWLVSFDHNGKEQYQPVPPGAGINSTDEWPQMLREPGGLLVSEVWELDMLNAITERLTRRAVRRASAPEPVQPMPRLAQTLGELRTAFPTMRHFAREIGLHESSAKKLLGALHAKGLM